MKLIICMQKYFHPHENFSVRAARVGGGLGWSVLDTLQTYSRSTSEVTPGKSHD